MSSASATGNFIFQHEAEMREMMGRVEDMLRSHESTRISGIQQQLTDLESREQRVADRERSVAEREAAVARQEADLRRQQHALPPPPSAATRAVLRGICMTCHDGICSRRSTCFSVSGQDNHQHSCHACYVKHKDPRRFGAVAGKSQGRGSTG